MHNWWHPFRFNRSPTNNTIWKVNIQDGTQMVLLAQPAALISNTSEDSNARTSPLITVTHSQDNACLPPRSTVRVASPTASSITPARNDRTTEIVGSVAGGLGLIAIICTAITFYQSFTRKSQTDPSANRGLDNSSSTTGGVTIAITQASTSSWNPSSRRNVGYWTNIWDKSGTSGGHDGITRESSADIEPPCTLSCALSTDAPPSNLQHRTEYPGYPLQPPRNFSLPLDPSPSVSSTDITLSDRLEDPSIAYGVLTIDEKPTELGDILTWSQTDPPHVKHDREPEKHPWSAHSYANSLESLC